MASCFFNLGACAAQPIPAPAHQAPLPDNAVGGPTPPPHPAAPPLFGLLLEEIRDAHEAELNELRVQVSALQASLANLCSDGNGPVDVGNLHVTWQGSPHMQQGTETGVEAGAKLLPPMPEHDHSNTGAPSHDKSSGLASMASKGSSFKSGGSASSRTTKKGPKPPWMKTRGEKDALFQMKRTQSEELGFAHVGLGRLVTSNQFEFFFAMVIVLQCLVMAVETQISGTEMGLQVEFYHGESPNMKLADTSFEVLSWIFGILFVVEAVLKCAGLGWSFIRSPWHWFDLLLVFVWLYDVSAQQAAEMVDLQMFRLIRLMRLLRLIRLVRSINAFDDLYLITTALKGSVQVLGWTTVVFGAIQCVLAIGLTQIMYIYIGDTSKPLADRQRLFQFFGTFGRSMLTAFEMTLGNWTPVTRLMIENASEWFMLFGIAHKLTIGFALVSIITGVFIQETFKVASSDDTVMMKRKAMASKLHQGKMSELFDHAKHADKNEDGEEYITKEGYDLIMGSPEVKTWLASMELDPKDIDHMFELLDDAIGVTDGTITREELIQGVAHLKGAARSIDLVSTHRSVQILSRDVEEIRNLLLSKRQICAIVPPVPARPCAPESP